MFDIGFGELLLIAVVALIVLGPERLPKAARFAGLWVRRARAQWYSVKAELEREMAAEELKRSLHETREAARELGKEAGDAARRLEDEVREAEMQARREVESMRRESLSGPVPEEPSQPPDHGRSTCSDPMARTRTQGKRKKAAMAIGAEHDDGESSLIDHWSSCARG